jgi:4-amino-4-deoxy-L-arabinose transferase-like glycosyltransferase
MLPTEVWLVAAITALGAALRFATITSQSYWFDEATTAHAVQLSLGGLLHVVRTTESTPPFYYVLAWVWAKVFGTGEAGLRSLSAVAGTALIPITYLCGRELLSRAAGCVAAALVAVSPFMIWYSQEARAYMLFAAFCGLSLLFFARARRDPSTANLTWWTICSGLALLTHFFAGFLVAPEALWLLVTLRNRAVLIGSGALVAIQLAVIPIAVNDLSHPLLGWIKQFPLHARIEQVPVAFAASTLYQTSFVTHGLVAATLVAAVCTALLVVGGDRKHRRGAVIAAVVAATVLLAPLVLAAAGRDYYIARNLIPAWVPLALVIAAACTSRRTLPAGVPLAALALAGFVYVGIYIDQHPQYQRPNLRGAAQALGPGSGQRAIVAYQGEVVSQPLALYLGGLPWDPPSAAPVNVSEVDVIGNTLQTLTRPLPPGVQLIAKKGVDNMLVERFAVHPAWYLSPAEIGDRARALLGPAPPQPTVVVQRNGGTGT